MDGWQYSIVSAFERLRAEWRIKLESVRIARMIYPALWESVRRKIPDTSETDLNVYAKMRARSSPRNKSTSSCRLIRHYPAPLRRGFCLKLSTVP